jgi:hypothetical protein
MSLALCMRSALAAELLEHGWRSGLVCHFQRLLSQVESRRGVGVRELRYQLRYTNRS